jgi:ornithine decarboxylase
MLKSAVNVPYVPTFGTDREAIRKAVQKVVDKDATGGEPFFIIDLGSVYRKHKQWQRMLPRVQPYYAVKCCNEPKILEALVSLGTNFDCASRGEIEQVMKLGVAPSRILFANPAKSVAHIRFAREVGVDTMTFDNEIELLKIKEHHPNARMILRILADDPTAVCNLGVKFGCAPRDSHALLQAAKSLDVNVVGVSFHVGSGCTNAEAFHDAVAAAYRVFADATSMGFNFTVLDVGGGFPGHDSSRISFKDIATVLTRPLTATSPRGLAWT